VATGFSYDAARRGRNGAVVARLLPLIRDIRRAGAAAIDLCSVGAGRVDAYYEAGLSIWDLAAGRLVATEAGAKVGAIAGDDTVPEVVLAAHPDLYGPLEELLRSLGAAEV
jgi:myo-inositol-1(or 4)-monophosphatase